MRGKADGLADVPASNSSAPYEAMIVGPPWQGIVSKINQEHKALVAATKTHNYMQKEYRGLLQRMLKDARPKLELYQKENPQAF
ncbi:hypothetical protein VYU27_000682 [Nannochloropsis oceanica]